jgi:hypothetical protein
MTKISHSTHAAHIEIPERKELLNSKWKSFLNRGTRKELDHTILKRLKGAFQEKLAGCEGAEFDRLWKELAEPIWTPKTELTEHRLEAIRERFSKIAYNGAGMHFLDIPNHINDENKAVQEMIQALFHGQPFPKSLLKKKYLKTVLLNPDPAILKDFFKSLQFELDYLAAHPPKTPEEKILWNAFRGNVIALLPFSYPNPKIEKEVRIPVLIGEECVSVTYGIEKILLSLTSLSSPMNALDLSPKDNEKAPPILCYMGTTYPGAEGFFTTLMADTYPGQHIGTSIYKGNKKAISEWFKGKTNVHLVGTSLGGLLSLHSIKDYSAQISRVDAYNPPGTDVHAWDFEVPPECEVAIYAQSGDIVTKSGTLPTGKNVTFYMIIPHQEGVVDEPMMSHTRILTGCRRVTLIQDDPVEVNKNPKRRILARIFKYAGPVVVFIPVLCGLLIFRALKIIYMLARGIFRKIRKL